jgi:hypothetical protein
MEFIFDEEHHRFLVEGQRWPSITQVLTDAGFIDTRWFTKEGRERGSHIHRIIHWHLIGELDEMSIDPELWPYFEAWLRFESDTGFRPTETETPRISELYHFGGIPDSIGMLAGCEVILERKTGALPEWVALQLAAQEILHERPLSRLAIRLKKTGRYELKQYHDRRDREVFLSALACWWWKNDGGKSS